MQKTRIADEQAIKEYAAARLLGKGQSVEDLKELRSFAIWAGWLHEELPSPIQRIQPVEQDFPREPILLKEGEGHVAVSDGFSRVGRYENMLRNLAGTEGMQHLDTQVVYFNNSIKATHDRFVSFANSLAEEILSQETPISTLFIGPLRNITDGLYARNLIKATNIPEKEWNEFIEKKAYDINEQYVHSGREPPGLENLLQDRGIAHLAASDAIHGDYREEAMQQQEPFFERFSHPYCDYLRFDGDKVGVNYMYGDQIEYFLDAFLKQCAEKQGSLPRIVMHGKVGGLESDSKRGDVIIPTGVIKDEECYTISNPLVLPTNAFNNYNARCRTGGKVYGVDYVLEQNREDLEEASETCSCTEMEFYHAFRAADRFLKDTGYAPRLDFIGYVSDVPLKGDTLAKEFTDYRGIYKALQQVMKKVKSD